MSQQDLSELVGYSGKSMISKIERGEVDISQTMIQKFADALKTTPGDLIGYEDQKIEIPEFDPDNIELIDLYSKLTKEQKQSLLYIHFNTTPLQNAQFVDTFKFYNIYYHLSTPTILDIYGFSKKHKHLLSFIDTTTT